MRTINKPWGKEELLEVNKKYVVKKLYVKYKKRLSNQYHEFKTETLVCMRGKIIVEVTQPDPTKWYRGLLDYKKEVILKPGDYLHLKPYKIHRIIGKSFRTAVILEASTPELNDVVRLEDDHGRVKR